MRYAKEKSILDLEAPTLPRTIKSQLDPKPLNPKPL